MRLSVGKLCMELGYGFYWPPRERPFFGTDQGRRVPLNVLILVNI